MGDNKTLELNDEELENVFGGTSATYRCGRCNYAYHPDEHETCPNCGASNVGQLLRHLNMTR